MLAFRASLLSSLPPLLALVVGPGLLQGCMFAVPELAEGYRCGSDDDCLSTYVCALGTCRLASALPTDAGRPRPDDGGSSDAGPREDSGPDEDAGLDAGLRDAGGDAGPHDAGPDVGLDGGADGGVDGGLDDGGPIDAGPACSISCPAPLTCDAEQNACVEPACGNGRLDASEGCDDGANESGDGCSAACAVEAGHACFGEPSVCALEELVHRVPQDHATLHAALSSVQEEETRYIFVDAVDTDGPGCSGPGSIEIRDRTVYLIGQGNPLLSSSGSGPVIQVLDGSFLYLQGFTVRPKRQMCGGEDAVLVRDGDSRAVLVGNVLEGGRHAVHASNDARLELRRNHIRDNDGGGVYVDTRDYAIESNVIYDNGSGSSSFGGVFINPAPRPSSVLRFNTIVANTTGSQTGGVYCNGDGTPVHANIIRANGGSDVNTDKCGVTQSSVSGSGDLLDVDPRFVNFPGRDLRLQPDSPLIDAASGPGPERDVDGERRPRGSAWDVGADEVPR